MVDRQYLEEQLAKDYKLLKKLEDKLRLEDDPKRQAKLELDIDEINQRIGKRQAELQSLENEQCLETMSKPNQENSNNLDNLSETITQLEIDINKTEKKLISLSGLLSFCIYAFPLLRWMHQPVPAKYVKWYFDKIQKFFMFEGGNIPHTQGRSLHHATECFFRCTYILLSEDFQSDLKDINGYASGKLSVSYSYFMEILKELGYKSSSELFDPELDFFRSLTLNSVLHELRNGIQYALNKNSTEDKALTIGERDILIFMMFIIDFLFKEQRTRRNGKRLDLPEGIVVKLQDVLDHAFKAYLGVKLPRREDVGELSDLPSGILKLMDCWKDDSGTLLPDE